MPRPGPSRSQPPRRTKPPPEDVVDRVLLALVRNVAPTELEKNAAQLGTDAAGVAAAIAEARRRITLAARFNRDQEMGRAYHRLNDLYKTSTAIQDAKTALAAQRELHRLLGLYTHQAPTSTSTTDPDAELARANLRSLAIGTDADSLAELARLAVARIVELSTNACHR